jgi:hypothetical protein
MFDRIYFDRFWFCLSSHACPIWPTLFSERSKAFFLVLCPQKPDEEASFGQEMILLATLGGLAHAGFCRPQRQGRTAGELRREHERAVERSTINGRFRNQAYGTRFLSTDWLTRQYHLHGGRSSDESRQGGRAPRARNDPQIGFRLAKPR